MLTACGICRWPRRRDGIVLVVSDTPRLTDPLGRVTIGAPRTSYQERLFVTGATHIIFGPDGRFRGVYVDDTTPNRDEVARELRGQVGKGAIVVVGITISEVGHKIAGCITALEFYPYGKGYEWMPLPAAEAYITQWAFAYPGRKPPTAKERSDLYARALAKDPKFVWVY